MKLEEDTSKQLSELIANILIKFFELEKLSLLKAIINRLENEQSKNQTSQN